MINNNDNDDNRELTRALLKVDFQLDCELPITSLIPPVPNRYLSSAGWLAAVLTDVCIC